LFFSLFFLSFRFNLKTRDEKGFNGLIRIYEVKDILRRPMMVSDADMDNSALASCGY
jgi:hypothetical protein